MAVKELNLGPFALRASEREQRWRARSLSQAKKHLGARWVEAEKDRTMADEDVRKLINYTRRIVIALEQLTTVDLRALDNGTAWDAMAAHGHKARKVASEALNGS